MEVSETKQAILDRAAANFMLTQISISTWKGVSHNKAATADAAAAAGIGIPEAGRLLVNVLGAHHDDLKKVISKYAELRTYLYANTLPYAAPTGGKQARGELLIPTLKVPEVMAKLVVLTGAAQSALEAFLVDYDHFVDVALNGPLGSWAAASYPSAEEVRNKFEATVQTPRPLTTPDAAAMSHLPAAMAAEFAEQHAAVAVRNLEGAKAAAIEAARDHMAKVVEQLTNGKRLHESLLTLSRAHADTLRQMATGTDNDPRLIELADIVEKQVANVGYAEQWNDRPTQRENAATAARTAVKGLTAMADDAQSAATAPAEVQIGGAMAELW